MSSDHPANRASGLSIVTFVLLLAVMGVLAARFWFESGSSRQGADPNAQPRAIEPRGDLAADEKTNIDIFEQCAPSTVHVRTFTDVRRGPFDLNVLKIPQGSGTGIVWDEKGRIVTNYHVIAGARRDDKVDPSLIQVTLANHSSYNVYDVNYAADKDVAVLWIDAPKNALRVIKVGESKNLKVGQKVWAIGNPFGLDQSLTTGIISAVGREIQSEESSAPMRGLIQTDAAINPGNSGGPLLDSAGRLIGVNTAIVSPSGASAGIGFAIPIDEVNREVTLLIRKEKRVRPVLGVYIASEDIVRKLGVEGILVMQVVPDGPADKAGIKPTTREDGKIRLGDIIEAIDGKKVHSRVELSQVLEDNFAVGQEVTVKVLHDVQGERHEVDLKLTLSGSTR